MATAGNSVWGDDEEGWGVGGWDVPIRGVGEVGEVWERFDDEMGDEEEEEDEERNYEN